MAGESARDAARRQHEKAERLMRSAQRYERGAQGEQETAAALAGLPGDRWTAFHDVHWPGRRYANVDHVVVGPGGVFVIDSKNWSGSITVRDQVLRQNGRSRETTVAAAADAAIAVAGITSSVPTRHVQPVLCFTRDEPVSGWARDVMLCSTSNVVAMLLSRPEVLDDAVVRRASLELDVSLRAATERPFVAPARPAGRAPSRRPPRTAPPRRGSAAPHNRRKSPGSSGKALLVAGALLLVLGVTAPMSTAIAQGIAHLLTGELVKNDQPVKDVPPSKPDHPQRSDRERQP